MKPFLEENYGIKKYVRLENGKILKSYYDDACEDPRRIEKSEKGKGYDMFYDEVLGSCIVYRCSKIVATSDVREDLEKE